LNITGTEFIIAQILQGNIHSGSNYKSRTECKMVLIAINGKWERCSNLAFTYWFTITT